MYYTHTHMHACTHTCIIPYKLCGKDQELTEGHNFSDVAVDVHQVYAPGKILSSYSSP